MVKVKGICNAVLLLVVIFFISGCQSAPKSNNLYPKDDIREYDKIKQGKYDSTICAPMKDFIVKGIIFVESKVTIDVNGEKTGSEITNYMLMKEAQKLGADDVINVKIDEIEDHKVIDSYSTKKQVVGAHKYEKGEFVKRKYKQYNYTYQATGLAIKYTNAITENKNAPIIFDSIATNVTKDITKDKNIKNSFKKNKH